MKEKSRGLRPSDPGPEGEAAQDSILALEDIMHRFDRKPEEPPVQPPEREAAPAAAAPRTEHRPEPKADTGRFDFLDLLKQVQEQDGEAAAPLTPQTEDAAAAGQERAEKKSDVFTGWDSLLPPKEEAPALESWETDWEKPAETAQKAPENKPEAAPRKDSQPKTETPRAARRPDPRMEKWAEELSFHQKLPETPGHVPDGAEKLAPKVPRQPEPPRERPVQETQPEKPTVPQDTLTSLFGDDPVMQYWLRTEEPEGPKVEPSAPAREPAAPVTDDTLTGLLRDIRAEIGEEPREPADQPREPAAQERPESGFRRRWGKRWQQSGEPEKNRQETSEPIRYRTPSAMPMKPTPEEKPAAPEPREETSAPGPEDWREDTFSFPELEPETAAAAEPETAALPEEPPAERRDAPEGEAAPEEPAPEPEKTAGEDPEEDDLMRRIASLLEDAPAEQAGAMADETIRFTPPSQEQTAPVGEETVRFDAIREPEPPIHRRTRHPEHRETAEEPAPVRRARHPAAPPLSAEQRYREAAEGLGGALTRLFISLGAAAAALGLSVAQSAGWITLSGGVSFPPFVEIALLLVCALMAFDVLADGLGQLAGKHFTLNTLAVLGTILSLIDGVFSLLSGTSTYCPLACLLLLCAQWGLYLNRRAQMAGMDLARRCDQGEALAREHAILGKRPGVLRGDWDREAFLAANEELPAPERILRWYGAAVPLISLVCALAFGGGKPQRILHDWTAILLAGTPVMAFVVVWRPLAILARQLQGCGAALAGWRGVQLLCGKLAFPITDEDLFPGGKLKMNGVKYFGDCPPETTLSYGTSVILASGSGLSGVFETLLSARNGRKYPVSNLKTYDAGGVSGEIGMDSVLVGSLRFMQSMGVDMPRSTRVSQAVYVAVNGELAGVFAISYGVTRAAADTLGALTRCRGVTPVMATRDFMLTQTFLRAKFRVDTRSMFFPPMAARAELGKRRAPTDAPQAALLAQEGFVPAAAAVIGARSLHRCTLLGMLAVMVSGLVGMIVAAVLVSLGAEALLSAGNLLKYMALWALPCFLLSMWTRFN